MKSAKHRDRTVEPVKGIGSQVISRKSADTVTSVLTGVVDSGSGQAAKTSAYEAAGKTGTAEENKAALFAGYTPELTTVVALFGESPNKGGAQVSLTGTANSGRANGGGFPAQIWADYTLGALGGGSTARFDLQDVEHGEVTVPASPSTTTSPSQSPAPSSSQPSTPPVQSPSAPPSESASQSPEPPPSQSPDVPLPSETPIPPGDGLSSGWPGNNQANNNPAGQ